MLGLFVGIAMLTSTTMTTIYRYYIIYINPVTMAIYSVYPHFLLVLGWFINSSNYRIYRIAT